MTEDEVTARLTSEPWSRAAIDTEGDLLYLGVQLRVQPQLIGDVMIRWRSDRHQTAEIGWVLHPAWRGRGYATEASRAALALAFAGLSAHRVVAYIDSENADSVRVAGRLGMSRDGLIRENKLIRGDRRSELVYSILRHERDQSR